MTVVKRVEPTTPSIRVKWLKKSASHASARYKEWFATPGAWTKPREHIEAILVAAMLEAWKRTCVLRPTVKDFQNAMSKAGVAAFKEQQATATGYLRALMDQCGQCELTTHQRIGRVAYVLEIKVRSYILAKPKRA